MKLPEILWLELVRLDAECETGQSARLIDATEHSANTRLLVVILNVHVSRLKMNHHARCRFIILRFALKTNTN
jgi:hypothetical protein